MIIVLSVSGNSSLQTARKIYLNYCNEYNLFITFLNVFKMFFDNSNCGSMKEHDIQIRCSDNLQFV
jgi:hypothetical protein